MGPFERLGKTEHLRRVALAASVVALASMLACTSNPADAEDTAPANDAPEPAGEIAAAADTQAATGADSTEAAAADGEHAVESATGGDDAVPYEIECDADGNCVVDKATYVGWRTYHAACHVCHAQDAVGSTFAPSLVTRLQEIDKARFYESVTNGYTGQLGVMPAWGADPNVNTKFDQLYAYLKARSDGILGAGRPTRKR